MFKVRILKRLIKLKVLQVFWYSDMFQALIEIHAKIQGLKALWQSHFFLKVSGERQKKKDTSLSVVGPVVHTATFNYKIISYQRKFRNLTSDYIESCRWRSVNQEMWSRTCDTTEMCEMKKFWRVGIARNAVCFHSFAGSENQFLKTGGCGGSAAQNVAKICTTLWRESGSEVKIVDKNWHDQSTFWSSTPQNLHLAVARERFGNQNR